MINPVVDPMPPTNYRIIIAVLYDPICFQGAKNVAVVAWRLLVKGLA